MASFSSSAFDSTNAFSVSAFSFTSVVIGVDTNDGEETRKKYRKLQERRRRQIEEAFDLVFSDPITTMDAEPILKQYTKTTTDKPIQRKDVDLERFSLNPSNLEWIEGILKKREEEEEMIIAYLLTRH